MLTPKQKIKIPMLWHAAARCNGVSEKLFFLLMSAFPISMMNFSSSIRPFSAAKWKTVFPRCPKHLIVCLDYTLLLNMKKIISKKEGIRNLNLVYWETWTRIAMYNTTTYKCTTNNLENNSIPLAINGLSKNVLSYSIFHEKEMTFQKTVFFLQNKQEL
jgi:hypothetical protein